MDDIVKGLTQAKGAAIRLQKGRAGKDELCDEEWDQAMDDFSHGFEIAFRAALKEDMLPEAIFRMGYSEEDE